MFTSTPKKKQTPIQNDSIVESIRGLGTNVAKAVSTDVVGKIGTDALTSIFGGTTMPRSGELFPNQEISLSNKPTEEARPQPVMRRPETHMQPLIQHDQEMMKHQLESVRAELKQLTASIKSLNQEVEKAVMDVPINPGVYHLNFMERLRSVLKILREQINDSSAWLSLWSSRKQKKGYWGKYKKQGTKFGLSSERSVATQSG